MEQQHACMSGGPQIRPPEAVIEMRADYQLQPECQGRCTMIAESRLEL